ncbi:hypothetical protein HMN09_01137000 [Mycena chlorophos]|uniref:Phospholipase D/nuclease n=1 Tax=Mycena chlorophos TaxID=658473 RepID=A0A8H6SDL8_MYCCL|nr:hypothetical protein HMN09_01137000 [Mycena chlorophos]
MVLTDAQLAAMDDDAQLQLALQMSKAGVTARATGHDDDEDDPELRRALRLSLGLEDAAQVPQLAGPKPKPAETRAEQERQRLARRGQLPPAAAPVAAAKRPRPELQSAPPALPVTKKPRLSPAHEWQPYPSGAILRTSTVYASTPQTPSTSFAALIGPPEDIAFVIVQAYVYSLDLFLGHFCEETPTVLVGDAEKMGAGYGLRKSAITQTHELARNRILVIPPLVAYENAYPIMHNKLLLIFSKKGGLRVIVASANLLEADWESVENYLFVQDIPPAARRANNVVLWATGVEKGLMRPRLNGFDALPLPTMLRTKKQKVKSTLFETHWDWRAVRVLLLPSLPGSWVGWDVATRSGMTRLLRIVELIGASMERPGFVVPATSLKGVPNGKESAGKTKPRSNGKGKDKVRDALHAMLAEDTLRLDIMTGSMGKLKPGFIAKFRLCAGGRRDGLDKWIGRSGNAIPDLPCVLTNVMFPTMSTMEGNPRPGDGAMALVPGVGLFEAPPIGSDEIACQEEFWKYIDGIRDRTLTMCDSVSRSGRMTMHTKMILGKLPPNAVPESETESDTEDDEAPPSKKSPVPSPPHAWVYVGSHNLSQTAWGDVGESRAQELRINVLSYELGIVLPLDSAEEVDAVCAWDPKVPLKEYKTGDEPWIQDRHPFFKAIKEAKEAMKNGRLPAGGMDGLAGFGAGG